MSNGNQEPNSLETFGQQTGPDSTGYETKGHLEGSGGAEVSFLCETQLDPSDYSLSLISNGTWAKIDALSQSTKGYVPQLSSFEDLCHAGIILTSNGPLTKGHGDASLADASDVTVRVSGNEVSVLEVDPVGGIIILDGGINPGTPVEIEYHYISNPTIQFGELNNSGYLLNQWRNDYGHRFRFNTVLNGDYDAQPVQLDWRYRGFERDYSALLNDATTLNLNEPIHDYTRHQFRQRLEPATFLFDGTRTPSDWIFVGEENRPFTLSGGDLIVEDTSTADSPAVALPSLFQKTTNIRDTDTLYWNGRMSLESHSSPDVFTGVAGGFVTPSSSYVAGFISQNGEISIGLLGKGDEETLEAWHGWEVEVIDGGQTLKAPRPYGLVEQDKFLHPTGVYEITEVYTLPDDPDHRYFEIDSPLSLGTTEIHPIIEGDLKRSVRIFRPRDGLVRVTFGALQMPPLEVPKDQLPAPDEISYTLDENTVFFGSIGHRATNESRWDLVRFDQFPEASFLTSRRVNVRSEFNDLPPNDPNFPWIRLDDQGYATIVDGDNLLIDQGGSVSLNNDPSGYLGTYSYGRAEPFLDNDAQFSLTTSFRIHEFSGGIPASIDVHDGTKRLLVSVFDQAPSDSFTPSGFLTQDHPFSIDSPLIPPSGFTDTVDDRREPGLLFSLSGAHPPDDEGWTVSSDSDYEILHHRLRIGTSGDAMIAKTGTSGNSYQNWTLSTELDPESNGTIPSTALAYVGFDDGNHEVYVGFVDDQGLKLAFVNRSGNIISSSATFNYDWSSGPFQLRVERSQDHVTVFTDGTILGAIDLTNITLPSSSGTPTSRIWFTDDDGYLDVDYFDLHDVLTSTEYVGIFTGGNPLNPDDYAKAPASWFGTFLDLEIAQDPDGFVEVFVGNQTSPVIQIPYEDLPDEHRQTVETSDGFVAFGAMDPYASSQSLWKRINYDIHRDVESDTVDKNAVLNQAGVMQSPESHIDEDPEMVTLPVDENYEVRLSREGMRADRVLSVTDTSGTAVDFELTEPHIISIQDQSAVDIGDPIEVVFYHDEPFTFDYQRNNEAFTKLNEGTPPYPKSQEGDITTKTVFNSVLNDPDDRINTFQYILNDGSVHFEVRDRNDGCYQSLDFDWEKFGDDNVDLAPATDELGWKDFDIGRREDEKTSIESDHSDELQAIGFNGEVSSSNTFDTNGVNIDNLVSDELVLLIDKAVSGPRTNFFSFAIDEGNTSGTTIQIEGTFDTPDSSTYRWKVLRTDEQDRLRHDIIRTRSKDTYIRHQQHVLPVDPEQVRSGAYFDISDFQTEIYNSPSDETIDGEPDSFLLDRYGSGMLANPTVTIRNTISDPDGVKSSSVVWKLRTETSSTQDLSF